MSSGFGFDLEAAGFRSLASGVGFDLGLHIQPYPAPGSIFRLLVQGDRTKVYQDLPWLILRASRVNFRRASRPASLIGS